MLSKKTNTGGVELVRWLLVGGALTTLTSSALATPQGERVVRGNVQFNRESDAILRITASNGSIINYNSFNIGRGELVQFIQPSSGSRVLNRVTGNDPSQIAGQLIANGKVYIVNPAGVYFHDGALVNVGALYAAAGNISDADFSRGINRFTNVSGDVVNNGTITASQAFLLGNNVANNGAINTVNGQTVLASGQDVLIREDGSNVQVRVSSALAQQAVSGGIINTGTINAAGGSVTAATGDAFAVAIRMGGRATAANVTLNGGNRTQTIVSGVIDASGASNNTSTGGNVTVLGQNVGLTSTAVIDASGPQGGGQVQVGGGYQGQGTSSTASYAGIEEGSQINVDATVDGDGGTAVIWSDNYTGFAGSISAKGAGTGNGGLVETSSKGTLDVTSAATVTAAAARGGKAGLWLLDPQDVTISNAANSNVTASPNFDPTNNTAAGNVSVTAILSALNGTAAANDGTDVIITTALSTATTGNGDISWNTNTGLALDANETNQRALTLRAFRNININAGNNIVVSGRPLDLILEAGDGRNAAGALIDAGAGANTITIGSTINLNGGSFASSGQNFQLSPGAQILTSGSGAINIAQTGNININSATITSANGQVTIGSGTSTITVTNPPSGTSISNTGNGGILFGGDTTLTGNPSISSVGGLIEFAENVVINGDQVIDAGTGGTIRFSAANGDVTALGQAWNLTLSGLNVEITNETDFGSANDFGIVTINVQPGGQALFGTAGGTINFRAASTIINGDTVVAGSGGDVNFLADEAANNLATTVQFNGQVRSTAGDQTDLDVTAVNVVFQGDAGVGAGNELGDVTVNIGEPAATQILLNGGNFRALTTDFNGATLISNTGLPFNFDTNDSRFRGTLRDATNGQTQLSFTSVSSFNSNVQFDANVGDNTQAFGSIQVDGTTDVRNGSSITTVNTNGNTGNHDYFGPVLVDGAVTFNASGASTGRTITFYSTLDALSNDSGSATINANNIEFQDLVGETNQLTFLNANTNTTDGVITFSFTGSLTTGINTTGAQTYTAQFLNLATQGQFRTHSDNGDITYNTLIEDANNDDWMVVDVGGTGDAIFEQDIGNSLLGVVGNTTNALGHFEVITASASSGYIRLNGNNVITTAGAAILGGWDGDQIYNGRVHVGNTGTGQLNLQYIGVTTPVAPTNDDPTLDGDGDIVFLSAVQSRWTGINRGLIVDTSGRRIFRNNVGQGPIGNSSSSDDGRLGFLTTRSTTDTTAAGLGQNIFGTNGTTIVVRTIKNASGFNGNIDLSGGTFLRGDTNFDLSLDPNTASDVLGDRQLIFRINSALPIAPGNGTVDSYRDLTLAVPPAFNPATDARNLVVVQAFRTHFMNNVGATNALASLDASTNDPAAASPFNSPANTDQVYDATVFGSSSNGGDSAITVTTVGNGSAAGIANFGLFVRTRTLLDADATFTGSNVVVGNNSSQIFGGTINSAHDGSGLTNSFSTSGTPFRNLTVETDNHTWFRDNIGNDRNAADTSFVGLLNRLVTRGVSTTLSGDTILGFDTQTNETFPPFDPIVNNITIRTNSTASGAAFAGGLANASSDFFNRVYLDGNATIAPVNADGTQNGGGVNFRSFIDTQNGIDALTATRALRGLTVNSSGLTHFADHIGNDGNNSHANNGFNLLSLVTDSTGRTRFGVAGLTNNSADAGLFVNTNGNTTDIGDPVSLDVDTSISEFGDTGSAVRFRSFINSFNGVDPANVAGTFANPRALRIFTPNGARTEFWNNIGTGNNVGDDAAAFSDAFDHGLRFIQTDGVGITQFGNRSNFLTPEDTAAAGPATDIVIHTRGDAGATGVGFGFAVGDNTTSSDPVNPAIDMQDDVVLDTNATFNVGAAGDAAANRNIRFYETINSRADVFTVTNPSARSLTINNGAGTIAFDDNIGTNTFFINNTNRNGSLLFILTDTDAGGNSGRIRLGNNSGLNGAGLDGVTTDGQVITVVTSGTSGVRFGDQNIDLDADMIFNANNNGVVEFGQNNATGITNSRDRLAATLPGLTQDQIFRSLTINTGGNTRFFNTIGAGTFTNNANIQRRLGFITTDIGTTGIGTGSTRFDNDVNLQGRSIGGTVAPGQNRIVALTLNDPTIIISDNTTGGTAGGVTINSNIVGAQNAGSNAPTESTGGAMRFRGNVTTDGTSRNFNIITNAQTLRRSVFLALSQTNRELWVNQYVVPVIFGGNIGSSAAGGRFTSFTQNGGANANLRGTGTAGDIGNVPMVVTTVFGRGGAFSADNLGANSDPFTLNTSTVGLLSSAVNTPTFTIWTTGNIDFGQYEKTTAFGNYSLFSSAGQIFISDINAVGAYGQGNTSGRLIVGQTGNTFVPTATQSRIMVRTRVGSRVVKFDDGSLRSFTDQGVDYVANRINFRFFPRFVLPGTNTGGNVAIQNKPQFSTPTGDFVTINGNNNPSLIVRRFREDLYTRQFVNGSDPFVFDFDLPAKGISQTERATAFAVEGWSAFHDTQPYANPSMFSSTNIADDVADPVLLNRAEQDALAKIGVLTRSQSAAQMIDNLIGRKLFNDRANVNDPNQASTGERKISLPRLNRKAALQLVDEANRLLANNGGDLSRASSLIDQLGVNESEAASLKASLASRFSGAAR